MKLISIPIYVFSMIYLYKNIYVSDNNTNYFLNEFTTLSDNFELIQGEYKSYYENADTFNVFTYLLVISVWHGFTYKNGEIIQNLSYGNEISSSCQMKKSIMDDKNALVITFSDRYYEVRPLKRKKNSFLSIVRKIQNNEILDIHILENIISYT